MNAENGLKTTKNGHCIEKIIIWCNVKVLVSMGRAANKRAAN